MAAGDDDAQRRARADRIVRLKAESDARVHLPVYGFALDKYDVDPRELPDVPCAELLPICHARCCRILRFALSQQDVDEGVVRWDPNEPYYILHEPPDRCAHLTDENGCQVYAHRPRPCRTYDCREDRRIWLDFQRRILAP
jgi:Fe-S-cluster containining protein